jgi:protein arginine kinase
MPDKLQLPPSLFEHDPWESQVNPIWPASSYILHRNLAKYFFPSKLAKAQSEYVLDLLKNALFSLKELNRPSLFRAHELTALDKELLFEHFLCLEGFQNTINGQAFIVDQSNRLLALLNIEDHLQLRLIDSSNEPEKSWNALSQIDTAISFILDFAFSPQFGFLTADLDHVGTGLVIHHFLHLPALIHTHQLPDALKQIEHDIVPIGMEGSLEDTVGDLLILTNRYTIGITEESLIHALQLNAMKLIARENALRTSLKEGKDFALKDEISRAYGLLIYSVQLQTKEALNALSLLKLGHSLGWISGIKEEKLNEIFFKCRRAHLAHLYEEKNFDLHDLSNKRAEFIHKQLQGAAINI